MDLSPAEIHAAFISELKQRPATKFDPLPLIDLLWTHGIEPVSEKLPEDGGARSEVSPWLAMARHLRSHGLYDGLSPSFWCRQNDRLEFRQVFMLLHQVEKELLTR